MGASKTIVAAAVVSILALVLVNPAPSRASGGVVPKNSSTDDAISTAVVVGDLDPETEFLMVSESSLRILKQIDFTVPNTGNPMKPVCSRGVLKSYKSCKGPESGGGNCRDTYSRPCHGPK